MHKDLLLKVLDGVDFKTVAGLRSRNLALNGEQVDLSKAKAAEKWRDILDGTTANRASVAGRGLFRDAAADHLMRRSFFDGEVRQYQIVIPSFGTIEGPFQLTNLEFAGEHNGEVTYDMALDSAGVLEFRSAA